jgi:hypothetical protein
LCGVVNFSWRQGSKIFARLNRRVLKQHLGEVKNV